MEPPPAHAATKTSHFSIVLKLVPGFAVAEAEQLWSIVDSVAKLPPVSLKEDHMIHYTPRCRSICELAIVDPIVWVLCISKPPREELTQMHISIEKLCGLEGLRTAACQ